MIKKDNSYKISFDCNLEEIEEKIYNNVIYSLEEKILSTIEEKVLSEVGTHLYEIVNQKINQTVENVIKNIYENEDITIYKKTNYWGNEKPEQVKFKDLLNQELKNIIESETMTYYGKNNKIKISDYFKNNCINYDIQTQLDNEITKFKKEVSTTIQKMFDDGTKKILSEQVMQILISSDTYRKITDNIKHLALIKNGGVNEYR